MERGISELNKKLKERLGKDLPGEAAQLEMSPVKRPMASGLKDMSGLRQGAVLIAFYPGRKDLVHTVLIERTEYEGAHSGQISFPGGKKEQGDKDLVHTALREAQEEVNIPLHKVEVIGALTEIYIPVSKFVVKPVVGVLDAPPLFIPEEKEVNQILKVPLTDIVDDTNLTSQSVDLTMGGKMEVPCLKVQDKIIWGATAMMLGELRAVLKDIGL